MQKRVFILNVICTQSAQLNFNIWGGQNADYKQVSGLFVFDFVCNTVL
jgi:hypothetical protein